MAADRAQNLQDTFLNNVRNAKIPLTIFLVNGVKLQGVVSWFDNFCVLLRRDGQSQLVYKHAISTIMPAQPVQLYEPRAPPDKPIDRSVDRSVPLPRGKGRGSDARSSSIRTRRAARTARGRRPARRRPARRGRRPGPRIDLDVAQTGVVSCARSVRRPIWAGKVAEIGALVPSWSSTSWCSTTRSRRSSSATWNGPGRPRSSTAPASSWRSSPAAPAPARAACRWNWRGWPTKRPRGWCAPGPTWSASAAASAPWAAPARPRSRPTGG